MKIEDFKNREPFTVPEGYFDTLAQRVTKKLPAEKKSTRTILPTRWGQYIGYAATVAIAAVIGATLLLGNADNTATAAGGDEFYDAEYIDEVLNNYPIDDYTFFCCITGTDTNY